MASWRVVPIQRRFVMAFDIGGLLPGGAQFNRIAGDVLDIGAALLGLPGNQPAAAQAQAPAQQADLFQPANGPGTQQPAPAGGGNQQITQALNSILSVLTELTKLLGGGAGQGQQPAVGTGGGAGQPAAPQ